ncbi:MAG: hypothetical protein HRT88_04370 [Lentisphaeraceae bacterium]|nr:hypothetical protein [Lentisphaeraceae bacterium]
MVKNALFFLLILILHSAQAQQEPQAPESTIKPPSAKPVRQKNGDLKLGLITLHKKVKEISFPGYFNHSTREILEVLIVAPHGRTHEGLIVSKASPFQLEFMLYLLGADNEIKRDVKGKKGSLINIDIEWQDDYGKTYRDPVEQWILDTRTDKVMRRRGFYFRGSSFYNGIYQAEGSGNFCLLYSSTPATVLDCGDPQSGEDILFTANPEITKSVVSRQVRIIMSIRKER